MKNIVTLVCTLLFSLTVVPSAFSQPMEIWFPESNLDSDGFYYEEIEIGAVPDNATCLDENCNAALLEDQKYLRAHLLNESNFGLVAPGSWTGGLCSTDYWHLYLNGTFESAYPMDGEIYSWRGNYRFSASTYIELGSNNRGRPEHNEANLYYVPVLDLIIYKGIKSLLNVNENGDKEFTYYDTSEYPYFHRCDGWIS